MQVLLAVDECGPIIAEVLRQNGVVLPDANWSKVFPAWLIAVDGGEDGNGDEVIGCIQVMPAKPFGWCAFLYTKPTVSFKLRAIALRKLIVAGMSTCHAAGCAYVAGMIDVRNGSFIKVMADLHFVTVGDSTMMLKGLR